MKLIVRPAHKLAAADLIWRAVCAAPQDAEAPPEVAVRVIACELANGSCVVLRNRDQFITMEVISKKAKVVTGS